MDGRTDGWMDRLVEHETTESNTHPKSQTPELIGVSGLGV